MNNIFSLISGITDQLFTSNYSQVANSYIQALVSDVKAREGYIIIDIDRLLVDSNPIEGYLLRLTIQGAEVVSLQLFDTKDVFEKPVLLGDTCYHCTKSTLATTIDDAINNAVIAVLASV